MREVLSRHYTDLNIGKLLISNIKSTTPLAVLDMGIGKGSLTKYAIERWKEATFYGTDIDKDVVSILKNEYPNSQLFHSKTALSHERSNSKNLHRK